MPLAACGPKRPPAAAAPAAPPPAEVGVVVVAPGTVGLVTELPGRLEASRVAQVRARAAGIVQRRLFREGSDVKAGQPLFRIDDAPYRAALASAQAALARAAGQPDAGHARRPSATSRWSRPTRSASRTTSTRGRAQAGRGRRGRRPRRRVQTAQINLGYASVTAPIAGRIGRALVTEGALVGQGEATQLAVVQQIDPMYVNFTQSTTEVLRLRKAIASGALPGRRQAGAVRGAAWCSKTAATTRSPASCCSAT